MARITEELVMETLNGVKDPELDHSLVELGLIREIDIDGDRIHVEVQLTTPHCPFAALIERNIREALMALEGVDQVTVNRPCLGDA